MIKTIFIFFTSATIFALYSSYSGVGLEEIKQIEPQHKKHSTRMGSSHGYSNGGWSYGK